MNSGLYWNCCMLDKTNFLVIASWDTAQMTATEVEGHVDGYVEVMRRIVSLGNWERSMKEVFESLNLDDFSS
jgi:hypothetical protein